MHAMVNETRLWARAEAWAAANDVSPAALADLANAEGIDFATAVWFVVTRARHRRFVAEVDAFAPAAGCPPLRGTLWIVPAAGWRERPEYGGDGSVLADLAADFGLAVRVIETPSLGSADHNAVAIREALATAAPGSAIVASFSKGGADFTVAMRTPGPHREAVRAWLNVSGLIRGCPLVDIGPVRHPWVWWSSRMLMWVRRIDPALVDCLSTQNPLLAPPIDLPAGARIVSVVGAPLRSHLDGNVGRRHEMLAHLGPNDGFGRLTDAAAGDVYPVWGASHYLRIPGLSRVFYGILAHLARSPETP
jgi:hypothetical protein